MTTKELLVYYDRLKIYLKEDYHNLNVLAYFNYLVLLSNLYYGKGTPVSYKTYAIFPEYMFDRVPKNLMCIKVPLKSFLTCHRILWEHNKKVVINPFTDGGTIMKSSPFYDPAWQELNCPLKQVSFQKNKYTKICTECGAIHENVSSNKMICTKCGKRTLKVVPLSTEEI